jgi:hypothetical protein
MQPADDVKRREPDPNPPAPGGKNSSPFRWEDLPPAGPHEKPELTNHEATPGAGSLPSAEADEEIETGSG